MEEAITNLRKNSALKAEKKSGRTAVEGIILAEKTDKEILFVEVNCETDFVAKDQNFLDFCNETLSFATSKSSSENIFEEVSSAMEEKRMSLVQKIGENIIIRKIEVISGEITEFYIHSNRKIASGVSLISGSEAVAKEISMHIAATNPIVLSPEDLDKEFIEKEREIFRSQVENTDKPKEILEKMVEGKLNKQLSDISLLKQPFVKDPSKKIETFLSESNSEIKSFVRLEVGEGIEIEKKDFAEEVQSQLDS